MLGGSLVRMSLHQRTVPASSATLGENTARFAAPAARISAHCGPEEPRESRAERYCGVQNSPPRQPTASLPVTLLALLAMDAGRACLRPSENGTFLCGLHDRIRARLNRSQTARNKNPVGTTVTELSSAFFPPFSPKSFHLSKISNLVSFLFFFFFYTKFLLYFDLRVVFPPAVCRCQKDAFELKLCNGMAQI